MQIGLSIAGSHKEIENLLKKRIVNIEGVDYNVCHISSMMTAPEWIQVTVDLVPFINRKKTPEQILAEERYTHYKAKMEAAKKDMEYWEERL